MAEILLFYSVLALLWPIAALLVLACALYNFRGVAYKVSTFAKAALYLVKSRDKKWVTSPDPGRHLALFRDGAVQRRTLVFVRHGESTWNETFNKGKHRSAAKFALGFFPGLGKAFLVEFYLFVTGQFDSWFVDAPLNGLGHSQAQELATFLAKPPATPQEHAAVALMLGEAGRSILVSSNLKRAVSTMVIAFQERLKRNPKEQIHILPSLQEISINPDTMSITPAGEAFQVPFTDKVSDAADFERIYGTQLDIAENTGNKSVKSNGYKRMQRFCDWVFAADRGAIIVGGHSLYFRSFFREYLPRDVTHNCKAKKIANGGAIAFTLARAEGPDGAVYLVEPESVQVVYGGYA